MLDRGSCRFYAVAVATFLVIVICMWAWYGLHSGMGYETHFPLQSESTERGRHFGIDMRRFTSTFYHLSYQIGSWAGYAGSYVPYQLVYAALWVLRGLLVVQIVRMLGDRQGGIALLAGAFTVVHGADASLNWVGQLNQAGFIFWMLLAFVVLVKTFQLEHRLVVAVPLVVIAAQLARVCIYSYESPLPLVFGFPVLVLTFFLGWSWRRAMLLGAFYLLPLQFVWRWLQISFSRDSEASYQFSVLREDWRIGSILSDWMTNTWHSLAFWQWPGAPSDSSAALYVVIAVCAVIALATLLVAIAAVRPGHGQTVKSRTPGFELRLLTLSVAMVVLSFPAYLLLDSATSNWRTQLLSAPGAGIAWSSALTLLSRIRWQREWVGTTALSMLAAGIVVAGIWAGQVGAFNHRLAWERHRVVVASLLGIAPRVTDRTLILLVNRQATPLIFGENVWWDYAVRLAYPRQEVTGIYFDPGGSIAPGAHIRVEGATFKLGADIDLAFDAASVGQTMVLEWLPGDRLRLARGLPDWLSVESRLREEYRPQTLIGPWPPDPRAVRRFGPIKRR